MSGREGRWAGPGGAVDGAMAVRGREGRPWRLWDVPGPLTVVAGQRCAGKVCALPGTGGSRLRLLL